MKIKYSICSCLLFLSCGMAWAQIIEPAGTSKSNPQLQWSRSLAPQIKIPGPSVNFPESPSNDRSALAVALGGTQAVDKEAEKRSWSILMNDKTLYRSMRRWAQDANYQLLWQIDRDYPIEVSVTFENNLKGAVEQVMAAVALTDYPIQALMNPNARIIRVVRYMDDERR
jgi:hypothetical protein